MPPAHGSSQKSDESHIFHVSSIDILFFIMDLYYEILRKMELILFTSLRAFEGRKNGVLKHSYKIICITYYFIYTPVTLVIGEGA